MEPQPPPINLYANPGQFRNQVPPSSVGSFHPLDHAEDIRDQARSPESDDAEFLPFLEREAEMPQYEAPLPGTRIVKIKPIDKDLFFDGSNIPIDKFISRYEEAGQTDGAGPRELAKQLISFMKGLDLKDELEAMTGYEDADWELLKRQLISRFGKSQPLVKYSKRDLR
ncbi:hypothetical protein PTTG_06617 [Puccinia triticina 1-1 BBBD Race 1]|uniref:Uncharacterized protein n=1 Tax=Puccinia triticina (isolate 1-1 / race 1 (BBBD)) TaxID=630390 RepID=A0A0C4F0K0_PUCT1|nr:hypothetical protein PTTG_06617 [Puccinia triticina 1-1 BBBD Race 1]